MEKEEELKFLRARVAELERANVAFSQQPRITPGRRWRTAVSAVLVILAVVLAPVAVIGSWTHAKLVETENFVQTIAPLAKDPAVQAYITSEVVAAINEQVDVESLVSDAFDGFAAMDLPPRAAVALKMLEGPAASGAQNMIQSTVANVVESPQFASIIEESLRQTHSRAIAIIQQKPGTAVTLADDGTISLQLGVVIERVKTEMQGRGFGLAASIPAIDKSIPLASEASLSSIRNIYNISVVGGFWLPWISLALAVAGIALARNRVRTLTLAAGGYAVALAATWLGVVIGKTFFVGAMSPGIMPRDTALAIYEQLTVAIVSAVVALLVLSLGTVLGGWFAGGSRSAIVVRGITERGFASLRLRAARAGLSTGAFGRSVERLRFTIIVLTVALAITYIFVSRPASFGTVIGSIAVVAVVSILVELLRHPAQLDAVAANGNNLEVAGSR